VKVLSALKSVTVSVEILTEDECFRHRSYRAVGCGCSVTYEQYRKSESNDDFPCQEGVFMAAVGRRASASNQTSTAVTN
jgi:hypothetical protein